MYRASDDPDDPGRASTRSTCSRTPRATCIWGMPRRSAGETSIARFRWMQGYNVLHPIGWDSFGLPAENAAIKRGIHPKEWTYENIEQQAASFKRMGMSFDGPVGCTAVIPSTTDGRSGCS